MSQPCYGRYHVAEPPHNLGLFHQHEPETVALKEVDHEPKVGVLDQSDLIAQGIDTSKLIKGAQKVDALGSCTANTATEALSNVLSETAFGQYVANLSGSTPANSYTSTSTAEAASVVFYHRCTDQTGDPGQEWPPTDCGSTGVYVVSELKRLGVIKSQRIAHGADNVVSLMQSGGVMVGSPFAMAWESPSDWNGYKAVIDGDGSPRTVLAQLQNIAGGHEFYESAIEHLTLYPNGVVNPWETICRFRNHWTPEWGDGGSFRAHLSTFTHVLGGYTDFRQLVA